MKNQRQFFGLVLCLILCYVLQILIYFICLLPALYLYYTHEFCLYAHSKHSQMQQIDSVVFCITETRAEPAVLRTYVENQAILEPILLYRASKCKQTKEKGREDYLWTHIFTFFIRLLSAFFFYVKMQTKQNQTVL